MKICFKDLINIASEKRYDVDLKDIKIENNIFITGIKEVKGEIIFYYDDEHDLSISYSLKGIMLCPDSISLKETEVDFDVSDDTKVVTGEEDDGFYFIDNLEISEFVSYIIEPEAPIMVENPEEKRFYSGDGWTVLTEEEYNKRSKEEIDPRLAKILEYKEE